MDSNGDPEQIGVLPPLVVKNGYDLLMDRLSELATNGDWWTDPWWKNRHGLSMDGAPSAKALDEAACVLKQHFDADWTRNLAQHPRYNIIYPRLVLGGSVDAMNFIVYLASMLSALADTEGLRRVVSDLKGEKCASALLEIESANAFHLSGFSLRFPREGATKSPDVIVSIDGTDLAVECKRLRSEAWEHWEQNLLSRLMTVSRRIAEGTNLYFDLNLNPRLTQILLGEDKESALNSAFLETVVHTATTAIERKLAEGSKIPFQISIDELMLIEVGPISAGRYGSITGMETSSPPLTRRIIQQGIMRAQEQLPVGMPGVIVVYSERLPSTSFFKLFVDTMFKAARERFSSVVAVVLCTQQTLFHSAKPLVLANHDSRFVDIRNTVSGVFQSALGAEVVKD